MSVEPVTRKFFTRPEAGDYLRLSPKTLAKWAWAGQGPAYFHAGGRVLYKKTDIDSWLDSQKRGGVQETPQRDVGSWSKQP